MNITITELSKRTGISSYEIRRRVHAGILPHFRVGAKQTKILIDENIFRQILTDESQGNMTAKHKPIVSDTDSTDNTGYGKLRRID